VDADQVLLLLYDGISSSLHNFHMLNVNIKTKNVIFRTPTVPAMSLLSSTTVRFFKSTENDLNRGFVIGISFSGALLKHNEGGSDSEISLSSGFTRGALLTNV
jgi:hypothetical protein